MQGHIGLLTGHGISAIPENWLFCSINLGIPNNGLKDCRPDVIVGCQDQLIFVPDRTGLASVQMTQAEFEPQVEIMSGEASSAAG